MKQPVKENQQRAGKSGERTGNSCPLCGDAVLRQENVTSNGTRLGTRLVCSKRGCPWQGVDR
jgi:hypothetical protein